MLLCMLRSICEGEHTDPLVKQANRSNCAPIALRENVLMRLIIV